MDSARRFAIVLRIWVRGWSTNGVLGAPAARYVLGAAPPRSACVPDAASTSRLMIRPPGPEPCTPLISSPLSDAMRRASGELRARPPAEGEAGAGAAAATAAAGGAARSDASEAGWFLAAPA